MCRNNLRNNLWNFSGSNNNEKTSRVEGEPCEFHVKYHECEEPDKAESYNDKDIVLCCFAVNDVASYKKLETYYIKEV